MTEQETFDDIEQIIIEEKRKLGNKKTKSSVKINRQVIVTPHQKRFLDFAQPDKREQSVELLFAGAVGSGKSTSVVLQLLKYCQHPNTVCLLLHLHLSSLKKSTLPLLLQGQINKEGKYLEPLLPPQCIKSFNRTEGEIILTNNSKIIISGVQNAEKLKSINASMACVDEITNLKQEDYFSILQRCRVFHPLPNAVFTACNPTSRSSWVYKYYFENSVPGYREAITVNSYSNKDNLPASYIKSLERLPEIERRRMLNGEWIQSGKQVFYVFDKDKHVKDLTNWSRLDYESFIVSQDFGGGGSNAYSGANLIGKTHDGIYHILEEFSKKKTTHSEMLNWMEQFRDITNGICVYDSANAAMRSDLENSEWKPIKSIKDIEGSIVKVNSLFSDGKIIISNNCPKLIKQLEDAVRDEETDKINKLHNWDLIDSFRYGICAIADDLMLEKHAESKVYVFSL